MTTTDTPRPPYFFEPEFDHAAARSAAVGALLEVDESLGDLQITSLGIEHDYNIRVQADFAAAMELATRWDAGNPRSSRDSDGDVHYVWSFELAGPNGETVVVRVYALVKS